MDLDTSGIIGQSTSLRDVFRILAKVAPTDSTVLVTGESGTGKELLVRALHSNSQRRAMPFVPINCGAIPKELLESELFGHEKGAFTGATHRKIGRLEIAGKGTVFLDEIGEFPPELQAKLLRVLQEREFQRVGGVATIPVKARIIAATNRNLEAMVEEGAFREDLYFRLKVFVIRIPPLRERVEDILPLAESFIHRMNEEMHKKVTRIPNVYIEAMKEYDWPGNVRELQNVLRRGMILTRSEILELDESWIHEGGAPPRAVAGSSAANGAEEELASLEDLEKAHIMRVLKRTRGNYGEACRILGISRPTLRRKISDYNLLVDLKG